MQLDALRFEPMDMNDVYTLGPFLLLRGILLIGENRQMHDQANPMAQKGASVERGDRAVSFTKAMNAVININTNFTAIFIFLQ